MRINTNVASLTAMESNVQVNKNLTSSLEKLSSGLRINKASDDASGMAIADKLRTQASALGQSISNANNAASLIQIADKAMAEQSNILDIIKTKLIQAATSTTSAEGREAIRKDIAKLHTQLDNIAEQTNYNGTKLLQKDSEYAVGATNTQAATVANTTANAAGQYQVHTTGNFTAVTSANLSAVTIGDTIYRAAIGDTAGTIALVDGSSVADVQAILIEKINAGGRYTAVASEDGLTITANAMEANVAITATSDDGTAIDGTTTTNGVVAQAQVNTMTISALEAGDSVSFQIDGNDFTYTAEAAKTGTEAAAAIAALIENQDDIKDLVVATSSGANLVLTATTAGTAFTITDSNGDAYTAGSSGTNFATNSDGLPTGTDALSFQIGELTTNNINTAGGVNANRRGLGLSDFSAANSLTSDAAESEMARMDTALSTLNGWRSDFGSTQNQLESSIRNMMTTQTNIKAAESVIRDVDYAAESANFNKQNIIAQAGTYALSQANTIQQNVLRLLQ